jgi:hypothetical protein
MCLDERIKLKYEGGGVVQIILELFRKFAKLKLGEPIRLVVERDLDKRRICKKSRSEIARKTRVKIKERLLA